MFKYNYTSTMFQMSANSDETTDRQEVISGLIGKTITGKPQICLNEVTPLGTAKKSFIHMGKYYTRLPKDRGNLYPPTCKI